MAKRVRRETGVCFAENNNVPTNFTVNLTMVFNVLSLMVSIDPTNVPTTHDFTSSRVADVAFDPIC